MLWSMARHGRLLMLSRDDFSLLATTFKRSKTPFEVRRPPVRLGEDNDYLYREVLKLPEDEYDRLKALGQIGMDYPANVK